MRTEIQGCMEAWMLLGLSCMEAAMLNNVWWQLAGVLCKNIYRRSKWNAHRNPGVYKGLKASGGVRRPKCFSGVWRHQCSKMYDGSKNIYIYFSKVYFLCQVFWSFNQFYCFNLWNGKTYLATCRSSVWSWLLQLSLQNLTIFLWFAFLIFSPFFSNIFMKI